MNDSPDNQPAEVPLKPTEQDDSREKSIDQPLSGKEAKEITKPSEKDLEWRAKYAKYGMTEDLVVCDWETWKESEPSSSISTDHSQQSLE